jgi:hypothetical protein
MWMTVICFAPEMGAILAMGDWVTAKASLREVTRNLPAEEAQKFSLAHAYCCKAGGIAVRKPSLDQLPGDKVADAGNREDLNYFVCTLGK